MNPEAWIPALLALFAAAVSVGATRAQVAALRDTVRDLKGDLSALRDTVTELRAAVAVLGSRA